MRQFDTRELEKDILREAKVLHIPIGTAEAIAQKTAKQVEKWIKKRPAVTVSDINQRTAIEIAKYNTDLAYVYQNRDKII